MKLLWITLTAATAFAQTKSLTCDDRNNNNDRQSRFCEMREQTIAYGGRLTVDGGGNGGQSNDDLEKGTKYISLQIITISENFGFLT